MAAAAGREDFAAAASECLAFEDSSYDAERHNWPDLRGGGAPTFPCQWCHGAPGIGLARLAMARLDVTRLDVTRLEMTKLDMAALSATKIRWLNANTAVTIKAATTPSTRRTMAVSPLVAGRVMNDWYGLGRAWDS